MGEVCARLDDLVLKASAGDASSLELILMHFHDPLLRFIRGLESGQVLYGAAAEDVLQETMIEAFRGIRKLEARGSEAFLAWLKAIARTRLINLVKAARAQKRGGGRQPIVRRGDEDATATSILNLIAARDPTPSLIVRRAEAVGAIHRAITRLEPAQRELIECRYGQGMSVEELAARTGKSKGAIKMLIHRVVKDLRAAVSADIGESSAGV